MSKLIDVFEPVLQVIVRKGGLRLIKTEFRGLKSLCAFLTRLPISSKHLSIFEAKFGQIFMEVAEADESLRVKTHVGRPVSPDFTRRWSVQKSRTPSTRRSGIPPKRH
jgi:hypothetical protein